MRYLICILILGFLISGCSSFNSYPTLPILATTITPLPSKTSTPIVLPATWTPFPSETPKPPEFLPTRTPFYTATIPVSQIQTIMAKPLPKYYGGNQGGQPSGYYPLEVLNPKCEPTLIHAIKISGTMKNSGSYTIETAELRGRIYDSSGKQINTNVGYADSDKIFPGTSSTFYFFVDDPNDQFHNCKLEWERVDFE